MWCLMKRSSRLLSNINIDSKISDSSTSDMAIILIQQSSQVVKDRVSQAFPPPFQQPPPDDIPHLPQDHVNP